MSFAPTGLSKMLTRVSQIAYDVANGEQNGTNAKKYQTNTLDILLFDRKAKLLTTFLLHTEENCLSKMARMTLCLSKMLSCAASIRKQST